MDRILREITSVKVGDVFDYLTVENVFRDINNKTKDKTRCICRCVCGAEKQIAARHLKSGTTKSCGCLAANRRTNTHPSWTGFGEISGSYWSSIQYGAKRRGIIFEISIQEAWDLFIKQNRKCALTGDPIRFSKNLRKDRGTASLDRLDSFGPYHIKNVQWVDKDINELKMGRLNSNFIEICIKIAKTAEANHAKNQNDQ